MEISNRLYTNLLLMNVHVCFMKRFPEYSRHQEQGASSKVSKIRILLIDVVQMCLLGQCPKKIQINSFQLLNLIATLTQWI